MTSKTMLVFFRLAIVAFCGLPTPGQPISWAESFHALDTTKIAVVSDVHLNPFNSNDLNNITFKTFINFLKKDKYFTHLVINGDFYHGPYMDLLNEPDRVQLYLETLSRIKLYLGVDVFFNIGNHEEKLSGPPRAKFVDTDFSNKLQISLENTGIHVIGINPQEQYKLQIGNLEFLIGHFPFVQTDYTALQYQRITKKNGPNRSATDVTILDTKDEIVRIASDIHVPLSDPELGVHNTGKLAHTPNLPDEPNTFLVVTRYDRGRLYILSPDGTASPLPLPCRSLLLGK